MFLEILRFEVHASLRRRSTYVPIALMFGLGALYSYLRTSGMEGGVLRPLNDAYSVAVFLAVSTLLGAYIPLSQFAEVVRRDEVSGMSDIVRASAARDPVVLMARFIAAMLPMVVAFAAAAVGFELFYHMPWVDARLAVPLQASAYVRNFAILVLPTLFVLAATTMLVTSLSRSNYSAFILLIAVYMLYAFSLMASRRTSSLGAGSLFDPTGYNALLAVTWNWTNADKATLPLPLDGWLGLNRVLWVGAAVVALGWTCVLSARRDGASMFGKRTVRTTKVREVAARTDREAIPAAPLPDIVPDHGSRILVTPAESADWSAFALRLRFEFAGLARSWGAWLLLSMPVVIAYLTLLFGGSDDELQLLPVTASVTPKLSMAAIIPLLLFCVLYCGEMVWRERHARISEIMDSTMAPGFVFLGSKVVALAAILLVQILILAAMGVGYQLRHGAPQINISYYAVDLLINLGWPLVLISMLVMLIHVVTPSRGVGHLASLCAIGVLLSYESMGIEHRLLRFADAPTVTLSDMNGVGHMLKAAVWFMLYWSGVAALMLLLADRLRDQAYGTPLLTRIYALRQTPLAIRKAAAVLAAVTCAVGAFILWNIHGLNAYTTAVSTENAVVELERTFGALVVAPQPRITAIDVAVDLVPEQRTYRVSGSMVLTNKSPQRIETLYVTTPFDTTQLSIGGIDAGKQPANDVFVIKLPVALQPGETITLTFTGAERRSGFSNNGDNSGIYYNGTFLRSTDLIPSIGFAQSSFLQDERRRLANGLPTLDDLPKPGDEMAFRRNFLSHDADLIDFAVTVSTSPDQTAIAPGYLKREWTENSRRYFRYEMDKPIANFWSVLSARYAIARDRWNDVELSILHHPSHSANLPAMFEGLKLALAYASEAFGPYQFRQLRVAEFPYSNFAQSFPNTVPFSENANFIVDPTAAGAFEFGVVDIAAHEVAHQWWGNRVVPADMPGAQFLSETLAEYTMLMVIKRRYGEEAALRLLLRDVDRYLKSRGTGDKERPLVQVKPRQSDIAYRKGGIAMYELQRVVGEKTVNRALARYAREYGGKSDPYPVADDLIRILKEEIDTKHHELIADLFERITLWEFKPRQATVEKTSEGKWRVTVRLSARKLVADENGVEAERPMDQSVQVGFFKADPRKSGPWRVNQVRVASFRLQSGAQTVTATLDAPPAFVTINPFQTLIQRNADAATLAVSQ